MLKFLKRFEFSFFRLQGELGFGFGLCKWSLSIEFLIWHFSVEFYTDERRIGSDRARAFLKELRDEWSEELDQA
jgi:hypothetical protein